MNVESTFQSVTTVADTLYTKVKRILYTEGDLGVKLTSTDGAGRPAQLQAPISLQILWT